MMKSSLMRMNLIFILLLLFIPNLVSAETQTFIKEYTYHAGDEDSRNSSRTIALREVKRLLLEELGTYLESQTEVKNFQMTKDQITTLTAGIVSAEVIEDTWDGKVYWLKAKIAVNPQDVIKSIDSLRKDRAKVKELEELRKKSEELLEENERLSKELKIAEGGKKQKVAQAYKRNIDNLSATEWFEKGYKLGISGDNTDAVKAYNKAIELNPQLAEAYRDRAFVYGALGNYRQAIKDFSKAIKLNSQLVGAYVGRGLAYDSLGNHQQAIKDLSKAIELSPQDAFAYRVRGVAYGMLGNHQRAIGDYSKVIELDPQNAGVYALRGATYYMLGNYRQAVKDSSRAIELNPQDEKPYYGRALAYGALGDYQQATADMKIAARLGYKEAQDFLRSKGISWE